MEFSDYIDSLIKRFPTRLVRSRAFSRELNYSVQKDSVSSLDVTGILDELARDDPEASTDRTTIYSWWNGENAPSQNQLARLGDNFGAIAEKWMRPNALSPVGRLLISLDLFLGKQPAALSMELRAVCLEYYNLALPCSCLSTPALHWIYDGPKLLVNEFEKEDLDLAGLACDFYTLIVSTAHSLPYLRLTPEESQLFEGIITMLFGRCYREQLGEVCAVSPLLAGAFKARERFDLYLQRVVGLGSAHELANYLTPKGNDSILLNTLFKDV